MANMHYYETAFYQLFVQAIAERRQELLEELASGVSYEQYNRSLGHLDGIADAVEIAKMVSDKIRSSSQ